MKRILLIILVISLHWFVYPTEVLKEAYVGRIFLMDSKGNTYSDYGNHQISKYSPEGKLLVRFGRKGEGPSDIKRLGWFAIHPKDGAIYVTEFVNGNKWISKFSNEGKFLEIWKCQLDWTQYTALSFIRFDPKGNVYIETYKSQSRRKKDFSLSTVQRQLIKFSPDGKKLKTIYTFESDFGAYKGGKGEITIPFLNYLYWTICNDKIIVRENSADHISVFDSEGKLEKKIPLPFKKEKVEEKDIDDWVASMKSTRWVRKAIAEGVYDLKYWRSRLPFPEYKPISGSLMFVDSHGNLFSQKYPGYKSEASEWAKIDLDSGNISIVRFKPGERLYGIWNGNFYVGRRKDDDEYGLFKIHESKVFKR